MDREFDQSLMFDADLLSNTFEMTIAGVVDVWNIDYTRLLTTARYRFGVEVEKIDFTLSQEYTIRIYNDQHDVSFKFIEGHGHLNDDGTYTDRNSLSFRIDKDLLTNNFKFELTTSGTNPYIKGFCFIVDEGGT